jgi:hypothetical protein
VSLWRYYDITMAPQTKRATIYFDATLHEALREKAAEADTSISEIVNEAVRNALNDDASDLQVFDDRKNEPTIPYETFVRDMKRRGKL